ncbi:MAG: ATP-binding protein [Verrucomicrobia bacterium]|nr:ATP-binding protein [Verrucomicrobiota bacterium]
MNWKRLAEQRLRELSTQFPAVVVVGARQVGKTTLARAAFPAADYKDIESPLVRIRYSEDPTHELNQLGGLTILDEAQTVPALFPALRGAIDARRSDRQCHFCILGSAQPALIQAASESLAGRIGLLELDPLTPAETGLSIATHWLSGGFPEALRGEFRTWWEPYLNAVLQRDLAAYGFRPDAHFLRRLLTMLAAQQGGLLNLSALGNSLGVGYHAVQHGLDLLEGVFLIRRLPPYFRNIRKRLVKSPRVFVRDSGLLHHLLNIPTAHDLDYHPLRGASWEGFVIEDLIRRERLAHPFTQFFFWRTATGQEADLILDRGTHRIAIEIKANSATNPHDARKLDAILDDIGAAEGWLVGYGGESTSLTPRVRSISIDLQPAWLP